MNMRSDGAGEDLSPSIHHAGRDEDVALVMAELARAHLIRSFALIGYSIGGNLLLRFLADLLKHFRHQVELYPGLYSADGLNKIRTLRQFDEQFVA